MSTRNGSPKCPAPPFVGLSQRQHRREPPSTPAKEVESPPETREGLRELLREVLAEELGRLFGAAPRTVPSVDVTTVSVDRAGTHAEPLYIPERIATVLKGQVTVKTSVTDSGDVLDDSAAALRKLRATRGTSGTENNK